MSEYVRVAAGTPMNNEERLQLNALATKPDSEIDFSDIPERTYPSNERSLPLQLHTVTLRLDSEVVEWLEKAAQQDMVFINATLKRASHRSRNMRVQPVLNELEKAG